TILAWRNIDRRSPRSLFLRKTNPTIYNTTVTAHVYAADRPEMVIVEDTADPHEDYSALYPGQTERIRSSVIHPVLGDNNELLGTLVVHCDETKFFKKSDIKFWATLLEIYAKRIAYQKVCLDSFKSLDISDWAKIVNTSALFDF